MNPAFRTIRLALLLVLAIGFLLSFGCASTPEPTEAAGYPTLTGLKETTGAPSAMELQAEPPPYCFYQWTPSDIIIEFTDNDPWEGFNRSMFAVNRFGMLYILRPIGWVWGGIFPRPVIDCIHNVSENLSFPGRAVSCLLQNRWSDGGVEFLRFLTNTTIGIGGLFDPADHWFDLYQRNETFGQAFECWGIGSGRTLILPVLSATNVRDHIGSIFDMALDIKTYLPYGASTGAGVNRAVKDFRPFYRLIKANADPYEIYKEYSAVRRRLDQSDWELHMRLAALEQRKAAKAAEEATAETVVEGVAKTAEEPLPATDFVRPEWVKRELVVLPEFNPENPYSDTVRVMKFTSQSDEASIWTHLSPWNSDFTSKAKIPEVPAFRPDREPVEYYFWYPKDKDKKYQAPLAFVLPGIGSHHTNQSAVALAEVLYEAGYAVAILPSTFCWNFYESLHPDRFPGYTPNDAAALRGMMQQVVFDLHAFYDFEPERTVVTGYSMGALHALFVAALEEEQNTLNIDRYVAINPPVDLIHALMEIDACAKIAYGWPPEKVREVFPDGFGKVMLSSQSPPPFFAEIAEKEERHQEEPQAEIPVIRPVYDYRTHLTEEQSRLLAALSFRYALRDVMLIAIRDQRYLPDAHLAYRWGGRTDLYRKLDRISFEDYLEEFVLPACREQFGLELSREELGRRAGLRAIEKTLAGNDKVCIFHTLDDILVSDADRRFLDHTLPDGRLVWFSHGAHLGNLYYAVLHRKLLEQLAANSTPSTLD